MFNLYLNSLMPVTDLNPTFMIPLVLTILFSLCVCLQVITTTNMKTLLERTTQIIISKSNFSTKGKRSLHNLFFYIWYVIVSNKIKDFFFCILLIHKSTNIPLFSKQKDTPKLVIFIIILLFIELFHLVPYFFPEE